MQRYERLIQRARAGERIVIDGATGSECIRRGAPALPNGWSGGAALSDPGIVLDVHADYLALGAELIASNTFATGRNVLEDAGVGDDFEAYNRRAVELAVEARARAGAKAEHVVVAGGISNWSFSGDRPSLDRLRESTVEQATIMRDAGADLLSLEMMVDLPRLRATLDAVATIGLPVWVGYSIGPEQGHAADLLPNPVPLREGGLLSDAVDMAIGYDCVDVLCIMHSDVRLTERGVEVLRAGWDGPIGAYAHAAQQHGDEIIFEDVISPASYAAYESVWARAGATIIGGCCGIGPAHMAAVAAAGAA
ncbi:MAG: homocysteine S-methyltransferase family protein [Actinomycetota bacterium]